MKTIDEVIEDAVSKAELDLGFDRTHHPTHHHEDMRSWVYFIAGIAATLAYLEGLESTPEQLVKLVAKKLLKT